MKEYTLWVVPNKPQAGDAWGIRVTVKATSVLRAVAKVLAYIPGSITL